MHTQCVPGPLLALWEGPGYEANNILVPWTPTPPQPPLTDPSQTAPPSTSSTMRHTASIIVLLHCPGSLPPQLPLPGDHLHQDPLGGEGSGVGLHQPGRCHVHIRIRELGYWGNLQNKQLAWERERPREGGREGGREGETLAYPDVLVLEHNHALGLLNEVVRQGCPLHNMLQFVCLPGDGEFNVALELASGQTHLTWNLATAMARPAAGGGGRERERERERERVRVSSFHSCPSLPTSSCQIHHIGSRSCDGRDGDGGDGGRGGGRGGGGGVRPISLGHGSCHK